MTIQRSSTWKRASAISFVALGAAATACGAESEDLSELDSRTEALTSFKSKTKSAQGKAHAKYGKPDQASVGKARHVGQAPPFARNNPFHYPKWWGAPHPSKRHKRPKGPWPSEADFFAPGTKLYAPEAQEGAVKQVAQLKRAGKLRDAKLIEAMSKTPQAVWLEQGSPKEVEKQTRQVVSAAASKRAVPVLVAYNIPFRDCAQFSAGGATTVAEYLAWIDGVVKGIGNKPAVVILEPDGLGIIPYFTNPWSGAYEWCQPAEADPSSAAAERLAMLNTAVDRLGALPHVRVYLDGTHSAWIGVGEMASRLLSAGVDRAAGVFVNASNYRETSDLATYGRWISACLELAYGTGWWDPLWCPGQYVEVSPGNWAADFSEATVASVDEQYAAHLISYTAAPLIPSTPFVIDTSRNGVGPWTPPAERPDGDPQDWCNPPDRGLGLRPSTTTNLELADAFLWIKTPGESDGECNRWEPVGSPDPVRGMYNPGAGEWFPEQALELVQFANPPLKP